MTDQFITTDTKGTLIHRDLDAEVAQYVCTQRELYAMTRLEKEATWLECWGVYIGSPSADRYTRLQQLRTVGDVNNDWRHRINVGKAFENVETILSYLQSAFFPNRDWFDVQPTQPGYANLAKVIKKFTANKLSEANFISTWELFIRQLLITGNSVLALPWRFETTNWHKKVKVNQLYARGLDTDGDYDHSYELNKRVQFQQVTEERIIKNSPDFEVLDVFDCYVDPRASDPNTANFIRRIVKTRAEVANLIEAGYFKDIDIRVIVPMDGMNYETNTVNVSTTRKNLVRRFQGINLQAGYSWTDTIEIYEFWGDVHLDGVSYHDVVCTTIGEHIVRFETNPYWCGKPFVIGTYIPVVHVPMAMGAIEPSLGMIHELNIITNQRLDNLELSIDSMFEIVNDGTLNPEDVFTQPGKVFPVAQAGTINPIKQPQQFSITYDESKVLEERIDKNTGTGPLIGVGTGRSGERVTAAEIQATRDAGGNRLSGTHKHIEETALLPCLQKVFRLMQQFVSNDEIVKVTGSKPGSFDYVLIGPEELSKDYAITPVGADYVADKQREIQERLQFIQIVSQYPQVAQHINYLYFITDLARRFGFEDIDQLIQEDVSSQEPGVAPEQDQQQGGPDQQGQPPQMSGAPGGIAQLAAQMHKMGGQPMVQAMQNNLHADGGQNMIKNAFPGVQPGLVPPPAQPPQQ